MTTNISMRDYDKCDECEYSGKLEKIKQWCNAYPVDVFPEPDFKKVHEILKDNGISLDSISASNMRHVLNGILDIINGTKLNKKGENDKI